MDIKINKLLQYNLFITTIYLGLTKSAQLFMTALRKYLTEYLLQCNKLQIISQNIRQSLASNPYFQLVTVFSRFDKFRKQYLQPADFSQFMLENQVYPTQGELYLIFKDFDRTKKGVVNLQQFQAQLLPRQNKKLRKTLLQRKAYPVQLKLQLDLEFLLAKYFQDKINTFDILNKLRQKMKLLQADYVPVCFDYLDSRKGGFLSSIAQIDNFLRNNGKALRNQQLQRIYRVLNFNSNSVITYDTFFQHLDPFELGCYPGYKQKIAQKQSLQYRYLQKKYEIDNLRTQNIIQNQKLSYQIVQLRQSNRRLHQIMEQQDLVSYYGRQGFNGRY